MFVPVTHDSGSVLPWEYLPAAAGTYQVGQMVGVTGGKITALSAASKTTPQYLCMANITAATGDNIPVTRVAKDAIYETTLSAEDADIAAGTLLEVSAGGLQADGTAAGSFEVVYADGNAAGSMVRGRFL